MSITTWTSEGMVWPPPVDGDLWLYLEAIRLALVERAAVVGFTLPTRLQAPLERDSAARGAMLDIYAAIGDPGTGAAKLYTSYVDYLDNGGNWTGVGLTGSASYPFDTSDIPAYDSTRFAAAVLAASGSARLAVPAVNSGAAVRAWVAQQRHAVEALRWTRQRIESMSITAREAKTASGASYAALQSAWTAAGWSASSVSQALAVSYLSASNPAAFAGEGESYMIASVSAHRPAASALASEDDYYAVTAGAAPGYRHEDPSGGTTAAMQAYRFAQLGPGTAALASAWLNYRPSMSFAPFTGSPGPTFGLLVGGKDPSNARWRTVVVNRWNVVGGFAFQ